MGGTDPKPRDRFRRFLRAPLLALAALLALAVGAGAAQAVPARDSPFHNLGIFARALAHVESSYVDEVDQDALIYGAIRGMVSTLDPHSAFMTPDEYRILTSDTEGRFGGIGVEIDVEDGWLTVLTVFEGGPAARAGIKPGDRFLKIEGQDARDMRIEEAIQRMRGEPGSEVHVSIRRKGAPDALEMSIAREIIRVRAVDSRVLPGRIAYVKVKAFQEHTTEELRRALDVAVAHTASEGGLRGVVIDLRDNAGGLLDEAVTMSDEFLRDGIIVTTRGRGGQVIGQAHASSPGTRPDWPMVVLVNGYTASAAEIVAGALHDHHRAVIVGTRTFGKGSVQNIIELPDGSALKLTIARYYTPSGASIQARGIEPDMVVQQLDSHVVREATNHQPQIRESTLEGHLQNPENGTPAPGSAAAAADGAGQVFPDDFQARMGYEALRALIAARENASHASP